MGVGVGVGVGVEVVATVAAAIIVLMAVRVSPRFENMTMRISLMTSIKIERLNGRKFS